VSSRSDAESGHAQLDASLWNGRLISYGVQAQQLLTLGYVLAQNPTSRALHRSSAPGGRRAVSRGNLRPGTTQPLDPDAHPLKGDLRDSLEPTKGDLGKFTAFAQVRCCIPSTARDSTDGELTAQAEPSLQRRTCFFTRASDRPRPRALGSWPGTVRGAPGRIEGRVMTPSAGAPPTSDGLAGDIPRKGRSSLWFHDSQAQCRLESRQPLHEMAPRKRTKDSPQPVVPAGAGRPAPVRGR
jgi:hypothetical protein